MLGAMRSDAAGVRRREPLPTALLRLASDQRLVDQVRAGSERAFEVLFDRHHRAVLAFCRQMLRSPEEAEDAVQHTFMAAYRDLVRHERPVALRPWLYGIARHRCLNVLRDRRRHAGAGASEPVGDQLAAEVLAREDVRAVLADMAGLPDDQRAALVLAELGDVSHDEIARILGCRHEKVKALVFQARASLIADRASRETPCADIRQELSTLRGGALRRTTLRRHLRDCPGCRAFREEVRVQRRALGLLLPLTPTVGLKRTVLGALFGSGGGTGGAALTVGALSAGGLAATALAMLAIPGGAVSALETAAPAPVPRIAPASTAPGPAAAKRAASLPVSSARALTGAHARRTVGARVDRHRQPQGATSGAPAAPAAAARSPELSKTSEAATPIARQSTSHDAEQARQPKGSDHAQAVGPRKPKHRAEPPRSPKASAPPNAAKPSHDPKASRPAAPGKPDTPPAASGRGQSPGPTGRGQPPAAATPAPSGPPEPAGSPRSPSVSATPSRAAPGAPEE
jgi:RNA polymerase sigma factor (sigma-70 family)